MFKKISLVLIIPVFMGLAGCETITSWKENVESLFTSSNSKLTVNALVYCANEMYAIAAKTTTTAVENGAFTKEQLKTLQTYRGNIRIALDNMQTAINNGDNVDIAAFTTSWKVFKDFLSGVGITISFNTMNNYKHVSVFDGGSMYQDTIYVDNKLKTEIYKRIGV